MHIVGGLLGAILCVATAAAQVPKPAEGDYIARDFRFHTGETLPQVKLHYTTLGARTGEPVLILHGTAGNGAGMLSPAFGGELFGPGQALDAAKYFVILPDALGAGKSSKPSDGLRAKFPRYNYDDMVLAQYRLVTEELGIKHLRVIIGNSMGGMNTWIWGVNYPGFADLLVPMASQPTEMSARNWMMRRMLIDAVRKDPGYNDGNYTAQPAGLAMANVYYGIATNGGTLGYQSLAPTREKADALVDERLKAPFTMDANDFAYQWDASRDYNPAPLLDHLRGKVLAINSADDERNPPETGLTKAAVARIKGAELFVIPASAETRGHGTTGMARFWKARLAAVLKRAPRLAP